MRQHLPSLMLQGAISMNIYLCVKTHSLTGLKYLCQTKRDPFKYNGSGKYWKLHLKKHGNLHHTTIIKECNSKEELKHWGIHYSTLWDVVNSDEWANLKPEEGDGGDPGPEGRKKLSTTSCSTRRPESISKRSGDNHYSKRNGYICKTFGMNNPMRDPKVIEKRSGDNNHMKRPEVAIKLRDPTIYCFENIFTGEKVHMTRYDFIGHFGVPDGNLSKVISKKRQSVSGWKLSK
jgi:hypothetical protein